MPKTMTTVDINRVVANNPATLIFRGTLDGLILKASSNNSTDVWVVDSASGTSSTGFPLAPGEMVSIDQYTTGTLYAYGNGTDVISYIGGQ